MVAKKSRNYSYLIPTLYLIPTDSDQWALQVPLANTSLSGCGVGLLNLLNHCIGLSYINKEIWCEGSLPQSNTVKTKYRDLGRKKKSFPSLNWRLTKIFGVGNDLPYAWWGFSTPSSIQPGAYNEPMGDLGTKESSCAFWERSCLHHVPAQGPVKLEHKNDAAQRGLRAWSRPKATQSTRCAQDARVQR